MQYLTKGTIMSRNLSADTVVNEIDEDTEKKIATALGVVLKPIVDFANDDSRDNEQTLTVLEQIATPIKQVFARVRSTAGNDDLLAGKPVMALGGGSNGGKPDSTSAPEPAPISSDDAIATLAANYGVSVDELKRTLRNNVDPLFDDSVSKSQRDARATVAEKVMKGLHGFEVTDDAKLKSAPTGSNVDGLDEVRDNLKRQKSSDRPKIILALEEVATGRFDIKSDGSFNVAIPTDYQDAMSAVNALKDKWDWNVRSTKIMIDPTKLSEKERNTLGVPTSKKD